MAAEPDTEPPKADTPPGPVRAIRRAWRRNGTGAAGSLLLHLAVLAALIWWYAAHPLPPPHPPKMLPVDLVAPPAIGSGHSAGTAARRAPRPRVATRPKLQGVKPQAVTPPPDPMEARIAALARLQSSAAPQPSSGNAGTAAGTGDGGSYTLADYVRAQILRRWWPDLSTGAAQAAPVDIRLKLSRTGVISDVRIVNQARFNTDKPFRTLALSARDAAILASPILLPPGRYPAQSEIAITLDPKAVLH